MPFQSEKQRRFLYAKHPEIAKRWSAEEKAGKSKKRRKISKVNYNRSVIDMALKIHGKSS